MTDLRVSRAEESAQQGFFSFYAHEGGERERTTLRVGVAHAAHFAGSLQPCPVAQEAPPRGTCQPTARRFDSVAEEIRPARHRLQMPGASATSRRALSASATDLPVSLNKASNAAL
ncbi:MAG TPA: hypothetical protein VIO38_11130, partial [Rariglobus sp.]